MTRQPRSQRKRNPAPIRLNQRDVSLFQALHDYRYLTTQHIQKLFFPSHYTAYDRLRKLYDHAYVDRVMQGVRTEQMNTPLLYVLDRAGFDVLQNNSKRQLTWKRQYKQVGTLFLAHNIAVRDCVVAVHRACRQYDWTLLKWEDEYNLKAQNIQVPLSQSQVVALIPDGYFTVQTDTQAHRFFLELDRGTMHHGRIADKVRIYSRYRDLAYVPHLMRDTIKVQNVSLKIFISCCITKND